MSHHSNHKNKLTLISLILMIFTSVFGFTNIARAYYLMGYAAIPFYIVSALTFFIPYAFMLSEFGAAFRKERGGIYSWMDKSVGPKYAFIVTFMWYTSYLIWMVSTSSSIWVPLSNMIFGEDKTSGWSLLGLSAPKTMALFGIILIIIVTFAASKGLDKIKKITSIGGTFVALANVVLLVGAVIVLVGNGFKLADPLTASSLMHSPNPSYQSPIGLLGFLVFAIFAYGGLESIGGLVDETENPEKTFPRGIKIGAIIIAIGYSLGILCVGIFTSWSGVLDRPTVNMANVGYLVMGNLGYSIGNALHLSAYTSMELGLWFSRFIGLSMFLALIGAFFTLTYAPVKQLIEGTPKELWPAKLIKTDAKTGMPKNAMWVQCFIVVVVIAIASFGGDTATTFLNYLILMSNVAMTIPYIFIALAFIWFKKNDSIEKPFVIYKSKKGATVAVIIVMITVTFANIFTIIKPVLESRDYTSTLFQIAGPIIFTIIALLIYRRYENKYLKNK
ncbi:glutamate/gamma-aminobutyrate family transporter YjeM [uncultured Clostridium sp.]|uniref:glutamate/gamma-aminobutyrate family transporter YjeM n=1 Tax=uncultured Clostridium sp. TaxID=59620 RepID=UPI0026107654|nr:glutamate/gamma-aminobutyrate family transporter YjeM [uncultured Clostridium sp.]